MITMHSDFEQWKIPGSAPAATLSYLHIVHDIEHDCSWHKWNCRFLCITCILTNLWILCNSIEWPQLLHKLLLYNLRSCKQSLKEHMLRMTIQVGKKCEELCVRQLCVLGSSGCVGSNECILGIRSEKFFGSPCKAGLSDSVLCLNWTAVWRANSSSRCSCTFAGSFSSRILVYSQEVSCWSFSLFFRGGFLHFFRL